MSVVLSFRRDGWSPVERVVSADMADLLIARYRCSPGYEVRGRWERVQSVVSVYRVGEPLAVVGCLMSLSD